MRHVLCALLAGLVVESGMAQQLDFSIDATALLDGFTLFDEESDLVNWGFVREADLVALEGGWSTEPQLMALDIWSSTPAGIAAPSDVVSYSPVTASWSIHSTREDLGLPDGVEIDALGLTRSDELLISLDTTAILGGSTVVADEDVWNATTETLALDGAAAGIDASLDVDSIHLQLDGVWILSFDTAGVIGGVTFDDEDILLYDPSIQAWSMHSDFTSPPFDAVDIDAVTLGVGLFHDSFESQSTGKWSTTVGSP